VEQFTTTEMKTPSWASRSRLIKRTGYYLSVVSEEIEAVANRRRVRRNNAAKKTSLWERRTPCENC
jgi:hypothetical protein